MQKKNYSHNLRTERVIVPITVIVFFLEAVARSGN